MRPSNWKGKQTSRRTSFAVGLVLYEMIFGRHPHVDAVGEWPSTETLIDRLVRQVPVPLSHWLPVVPSPLVGLVCPNAWRKRRPRGPDQPTGCVASCAKIDGFAQLCISFRMDRSATSSELTGPREHPRICRSFTPRDSSTISPSTPSSTPSGLMSCEGHPAGRP